ncbi:hypothetical protein J4402_05705 [Candidatus Pacearchaeota archaeon]|nr:hypothetical protein [Candidatus Pacearchaeota archaeon]
MEKRGDMTAPAIITLVLAITAFGILLIVLIYIASDFKNYSSDEVCRLAVLTRATAPSGASYVPLKCTTKKICITNDKNCAEFAAEKNPEEKKISKECTENTCKAAREVEKEITNAMYDCWNMMGQGKLSLFSTAAQDAGFNPSVVTCVICSRLAFNLADEKNVLGKVDIQNYIKNTQVPGSSLTYLQTFTDRSVNSYAPLSEKIQTTPVDVTFQTQTTELAVVFSQVQPGDYKKALEGIISLGATAAGAAFVTPLIPKGQALVVIGLATTGAAIYSMSSLHYSKNVISAGYCGTLTSDKKEARNGCSAIQVIPYETAAINQICKQIEGTP